MENIAIERKESDKVMDFIQATKEGKYTLQKPDLTYITYARLIIQENDAENIYNESNDEVILYGLSY